MDWLTGIAAGIFLAALLTFVLYFQLIYKKRGLDAAGINAEKEDGAAGGKNAPFPAYKPRDGKRGEARTCPVCAARFELGENVRSKIFPDTGKHDRLLHILGCKFCLSGGRERRCPVCGGELSVDEYLIARIFERPGKSHVHVQGCVVCLKTR
ncbi:MAG: hypothetical protein LBG72_04740 [Spirochaetaceae bacterium]|jgi:RNA polymerase subunit RPABC4/transcription elongation factor Spt4|nr:hypothetical protein [Spirochaetaceae bacterium]